MAPKTNPEDLTVAELRKRAAKLEIPGRSGMNKSELAAAVADAEPTGSKRSAASEQQKDNNGGSTLIREDAGKISAPSIGPHTVIEREAPEDRLARGEQSQVDAMGHDKRRQVMGKSYGPSLARQALVYGAFFAVVIVLFIGASIAVKELDKPDPSRTDTAPWAATDAPPVEPAPIDFPRSVTP